MAEVKIHDDYLVVIPVDVHESLGLRIGETIDFVVEVRRATLYPQRMGAWHSCDDSMASFKHRGMIDDGVGEGYARGADSSAMSYISL